MRDEAQDRVPEEEGAVICRGTGMRVGIGIVWGLSSRGGGIRGLWNGS